MNIRRDSVGRKNMGRSLSIGIHLAKFFIFFISGFVALLIILYGYFGSLDRVVESLSRKYIFYLYFPFAFFVGLILDAVSNFLDILFRKLYKWVVRSNLGEEAKIYNAMVNQIFYFFEKFLTDKQGLLDEIKSVDREFFILNLVAGYLFEGGKERSFRWIVAYYYMGELIRNTILIIILFNISNFVVDGLHLSVVFVSLVFVFFLSYSYVDWKIYVNLSIVRSFYVKYSLPFGKKKKMPAS